jgi:hypothetical protein
MPAATRLTFTTAAVLFAAAVGAPAYAMAPRADFQPHAVTGAVISQGANGTEQTAMCPPDEKVLSGGFLVSAPTGRTLDPAPGDVLTSRPTSDATGWIVAVNKSLQPTESADPGPADLTLYVVCTEGESTPGA